jgi:hypothetical protein
VDLPHGIKYLKLDCNNKKIIDYLPDSIEELILGKSFNLELNNLPSSIKKIVFENAHYTHQLNCLPNNIESIVLSNDCRFKMNKIPSRLKKITYYDMIYEQFYNVKVKHIKN